MLSCMLVSVGCVLMEAQASHFACWWCSSASLLLRNWIACASLGVWMPTSKAALPIPSCSPLCQVYQPGAGAALPSPTMSASVPPPVYQPAAAPQVPQVYQQPTAAAAFAPQRAGSLSAGMAQPAASFVPQQGPSPTAGGTAAAAAAFGPPPGQMQPGGLPVVAWETRISH